MSRPVTIGDVAAAAGVSITTVSHALNGKGRLPAHTRARVREVAERLGYTPSPPARALAVGRTGMLAVTVSTVADLLAPRIGDFDYFMQMMNAATSEAVKRGFSLTLVLADSRRELLARLPLDGAIVMDPIRGDEILELLGERGIPVVTTGRRPDGPDGACWVDNDHVAATRAMIAHLAAEGATRIALLTAPPLQSYTLDALAGFEAACAEHGVEAIVETVTDSLSEAGGYASASRLLASSRRPDAIYATLDRLAFGALLAAQAKGVRVPDALRLACCTDSDAARSSRPSLTTLSVHPEWIGAEAIDLLTSLVDAGVAAVPHRVVPFSVIRRDSTRRPRTSTRPPPPTASASGRSGGPRATWW